MKIISLAPSNTEILFALGAGDSIIAKTRFCDYPKFQRPIPNVGGWLDVNIELLKKYEPDIVMTSGFLQDNLTNDLLKLGIEVVHVDPKTLDDVYQSILDIGKAIGKKEEAHNIIEDMKVNLKKIENSSKDYPRKIVYCEEWHKPPTASGNWVPKLIEIAGGVSLIKEGILSRKVSDKEVIDFNPDIMVASYCGFGDTSDINFMKSREGFKSLQAVKDYRVHAINDSLLNRPGPRLVDGARKLAELIRK